MTGEGLIPGTSAWTAAIKAHSSDPEVQLLCDFAEKRYSEVTEAHKALFDLENKIARLDSIFAHALELAQKQARVLKTMSDMIQEMKDGER